MIGRRIKLVRNVCNLWDGEKTVKEGTEGSIVQGSEHDSALFQAALDDGMLLWLVTADFELLPEVDVVVSVPRYVLDNRFVGVITPFQQIMPARMIHFGNNITIDYGADPPEVHLRGAPPELAARQFWNAVHAVVGRPPLFPNDVPPPLKFERTPK